MTIKPIVASVVRKSRKIQSAPSTNENNPWKPPTIFKWSGHHIRWSWYLDGTPKRVPKKEIVMKGGWTRRYWDFKGASVIANVNVITFWVATRKYKNPERMLYDAWARTDLIAREFSTWQKVAIRPIKTEHPADAQQAHIVLEDKQLSAQLAPFANQPSAREIGMVYDDESHRKRIEFKGNDAIEGSFGADYVFKYFPQEFKALKAEIEAQKRKDAIVQGKLNIIAEGLELLLKKGNKEGNHGKI